MRIQSRVGVAVTRSLVFLALLFALPASADWVRRAGPAGRAEIHVWLPPGHQYMTAKLPVIYLVGVRKTAAFEREKRRLELAEAISAALRSGSMSRVILCDANLETGADDQRFLADELTGLIEREFPADPASRLILLSDPVAPGSENKLAGAFLESLEKDRPGMFRAATLPSSPPDVFSSAQTAATVTRSYRGDRIFFWASFAALQAANAADAYTSWGHQELNPILGRGTFGGRQLAIKLSISEGLALVTLLRLRGHPERLRTSAWGQTVMAGVFGGVAIHNHIVTSR